MFDENIASPTEKAKEKVKHFFVKTSVKMKSARGVELEETRDGARMEEVESYLNTLETQVKSLSKATLYLVAASKETSTNMHELGLTLFGLHQTYDPESASNRNVDSDDSFAAKTKNLPPIKAISNVFASLSAINKVKSDENEAKVGTAMHELEWSIKAARLAVKRRKNCQVTYNTYLQQIKNREGALEKLQKAADLSPQPGASDAKIADAQKLLETAKQSANKSLGELNEVTQRVFREMDRFKRNMDLELRRLYASHARIQMDYSAQLDAEWRKLLPNNGGAGSGGSTPLQRRGSGGSGGSGSDKAEMLMI